MNFKYYKTKPLIISVLVLGAISTLLSECIESWIKSLNIEIINKIYSYNGIFSTISLLTIFIWCIDKYLWRKNNFLIKLLIDIPNLNGRYEGELISSFKDENNNYVRKKCIIEIKQTASKIKVFSYYSDLNSDKQTSCSESVLEEIVLQNEGTFKLYYVYDNKADILLNNLSDHSGTCELKYYPNEKRLAGEYYNKRGNKGTIDVVFKSNKTEGKM